MEDADGCILRASPGGALDGIFAVPGDKSISHRALILGAMAEGETRIDGLSEADDVLATARALESLGVEVRRDGAGSWLVCGAPWRSPAWAIDCGNSGTTARLLIGAVAGMPITASFVGDLSLSRRPMDRVIEPLRSMGATIDGGPTLPVTVRGGGLGGIGFTNPLGSAQVKSALLLAGLGTDHPVEIIEPIASRDHSERLLRRFGCELDQWDSADGRHVRLGRRRRLVGTEVSVPGDPSAAACAWVAATLVARSRVVTPAVMVNPLRSGLLAALSEMGSDIRVSNEREVGGETVADIEVRAAPLTGVVVPAERVPTLIDEVPLLAIAAAFAQGPTVIHGLGDLRNKESDRLAATVAGLRRCGVEARVEGDNLHVAGCGGDVPGGVRIETHGDHRIAMAFLTLGLASRAPIAVDQASMIATSFPGFADAMRAIGADIEQRP